MIVLITRPIETLGGVLDNSRESMRCQTNMIT
jgi:hypothetical protein